MKIPIALVETWISIVSDDSPSTYEARKAVLKKVDLMFGSVELAQAYVDQEKAA